MGLELAAAVDDVQERGAAVAAPRGHAAGDAVLLVGLLARLEGVMSGVDVRDRRYALKLMRERIDALLAQALQLGAPVVNRRGVVHAAGGYWPGGASARSW